MSDTTVDVDWLKKVMEINNLQADTTKKLAEARALPWQVGFGGFTAGAAIVGAIAALLKIMGG